ncbi:unnamed protein product [Brachionus calyciflorus]|uniref:C2H2-type domain-containing protein n=1 Tax=Brachionus calyciflorus TaxID=104777 RepID=A0A813S655_9BILA|nr:unnamed protein product [Brachionus calyciflorus]
MAKKKSCNRKSKSHSHKKISHLHKIYKTKRKTKDHDQIHVDLKIKNAYELLNQSVDNDVPGAAQNYCVHCARYFVDEKALKEHFRTKLHKRRMKALETEPYTQEEAKRAAGMGSYVAPKKFEIKTQPDRQTLTSIYQETTDKDNMII